MRLLLGLAAATCLLAVPSVAPAATVTMGPPIITASSFDAVSCTGPSCAWAPGANIGLPSGAVDAPADGTITAWRLLGTGSGGGFVQLNVLRHNPDGSVTATSTSPHPTAYNGVTANVVSLPIGVGDTLGVTAVASNLAGAVAKVRGNDVEGAELGGYALFGAPSFGWVTGSPIINQQLQVNATLSPSPPVITRVSPASAPAGTTVTISGQHLALATSVKIGGVDAPVVLAGNDAISVTAPDHALGPADVQVTTAGGSSAAGAESTFTYADPAGAGPTPAATPVPLVLGPLAITPSSFRNANLGGSIAAARITATSVGAKVSYAISKAATVTFTIQRLQSGRRSGKRCVAPTRKLRRAATCTRTTTLKTTFAHAAQAGDNALTFTGRLANKALPRGSYRLSAVADSGGKASGKASAAFSVVR